MLERRAKPVEYDLLWNGKDVASMNQADLRKALMEAAQEIDEAQRMRDQSERHAAKLQARIDELERVVEEVRL
jgi:hypothetical protein